MYFANEKRYEKMQYNRLGKSGLKLPAVSLGLWHNFGDTAQFSNMKEPIITVRRPAAPKRISAGFSLRRWEPTAMK